jgi:predicted RNA-binding Zn-ribbon protein involved in translation (DUF1610 family)
MKSLTHASSRAIIRPQCPKCGSTMTLSRVGPDAVGYDRRTFECPHCGNTEIEFANIRARTTIAGLVSMARSRQRGTDRVDDARQRSWPVGEEKRQNLLARLQQRYHKKDWLTLALVVFAVVVVTCSLFLLSVVE